MKRLSLIAYCLLPIACVAQNLTTVTASSLYKGGALLPSGQICFTGTDANDNPIPFRVGGGGQEVSYPYCATVTSGAIVGSFQVANPANTAPANISYRVELFDQYNRLQKWSGVQFTGAAFNFDNYIPSANLPLGTSTNVATIGNLTVTGSCTGCGGGGGGATLETNGTNNASQSVLNIQNGTGTTASNPGGGNVQIAVSYGTTANTAAEGNDSRITGALQSANNLSDVASASTSRTNLGLGSAATAAATAFSGVGSCTAHQWTSTLNGNAAPTCTQPAFSDISGTVTNAQLHDSYSGVGSCAAHQWVSTINTDAAPGCTQPGYSDISGTPTLYYQTVQNASGSAMTQRPTVEFTGTAVSSVTDDSANNRTVVTLTAGSGSGSPAGSDKDVQINKSGAFGADSGNFDYDYTNHRLGVQTGGASLQDGFQFGGSSTLAYLGAFGDGNTWNDGNSHHLFAEESTWTPTSSSAGTAAFNTATVINGSVGASHYASFQSAPLCEVSGTASCGTIYGFYDSPSISGTGTGTTNRNGVTIQPVALSGGGSVGQNYAIYIAQDTVGSSNWTIVADKTAHSYFAGCVAVAGVFDCGSSGFSVGSSGQFLVTTGGRVTTYNGLTTAGQGLLPIVGVASQKSETAADTNVLTITPAAAPGIYHLRFVISVSSASSAVLGWTASWKDSNGNAQSPTNLSLRQSGTANPALSFTTSAAGDYYGDADIDVDSSGTNVVLKFTLTSGTAAAKVSATVERLQ